MTFRNRAAAGLALADALAPVLAPPFVVGAIPRGGVTVALPLVERFHAPLALVYASKLTSPVAPEFAFGALDEDGEAHVEAESVAMLGLSPEDVEQAKARVGGEIQRRMAAYGAPPRAARRHGGRAVRLGAGRTPVRAGRGSLCEPRRGRGIPGRRPVLPRLLARDGRRGAGDARPRGARVPGVGAGRERAI